MNKEEGLNGGMSLCSLTFHVIGTCHQCKTIKAIKKRVNKEFEEIKIQMEEEG